MSDPGDFHRLLSVIASALEDEKARKKLVSDPKSVLTDAGLKLRPDLQVEVLQNSRNLLHIVLPAPEDQLDPDESCHHRLINMWPV